MFRLNPDLPCGRDVNPFRVRKGDAHTVPAFPVHLLSVGGQLDPVRFLPYHAVVGREHLLLRFAEVRSVRVDMAASHAYNSTVVLIIAVDRVPLVRHAVKVIAEHAAVRDPAHAPRTPVTELHLHVRPGYVDDCAADHTRYGSAASAPCACCSLAVPHACRGRLTRGFRRVGAVLVGGCHCIGKQTSLCRDPAPYDDLRAQPPADRMSHARREERRPAALLQKLVCRCPWRCVVPCTPEGSDVLGEVRQLPDTQRFL